LRNRAKIRPRLALVLSHILEEQYLALNVDLDQIRLPVGLAHLFTPNLKGPAFFHVAEKTVAKIDTFYRLGLQRRYVRSLSANLSIASQVGKLKLLRNLVTDS